MLLILFIILVVVLVILFVLFSFLKRYLKKFHETFKSDYSDYNKIDRIMVDDKYGYCLGASLGCVTGAPIKIGLYGNGNGDTYKSQCDDGSLMVCNNFVSNNFDTVGDNYVWKTPKNNPILFSKMYKGFTEPTPYIPAIINNDLINFYDKNNKIIETINKCSLLGINENKCKSATNIPFSFADTSNNDINAFNDETGYNIDPNTIGSFDQTSKPNTLLSSEFIPNYSALQCIADYGTNPGTNMCNGEIGLLDDTSLICPYYKPICDSYRCGSTLGTCVEAK
jgi:hypothetical protein